MTIDKAIKELSNHLKSYKPGYEGNFGNAIKLGIEALKWVKEFRGCCDFHEDDKLLGETEEWG